MFFKVPPLTALPASYAAPRLSHLPSRRSPPLTPPLTPPPAPLTCPLTAPHTAPYPSRCPSRRPLPLSPALTALLTALRLTPPFRALPAPHYRLRTAPHTAPRSQDPAPPHHKRSEPPKALPVASVRGFLRGSVVLPWPAPLGSRRSRFRHGAEEECPAGPPPSRR